jgi:apolipoprotein N-acyltransferase
MTLSISRRTILLGIAPLVSGLCCTLAFAPVEQPWMAWIFPAPLVLALFFCRPVKLREAAVAGWLAGMVFFAASLFWMTEVTVLGWLGLTVHCSVFYLLWGATLGYLTGKLPEELDAGSSLRFALFSASAFTGLEWVRSWLFSGFSWNSLGISQINLPAIAQIAELGGVHLITWLVVFCGTVFVLTGIRLYQEAIRFQSLRPHFEFMVALGLLGMVLYFGVDRLVKPAPVLGQLQILAIQPDIPQDPWGAVWDTDQALDRCIMLTDAALGGEGLGEGERIDLLIWPETPISGSLDELPMFKNFQDRTVPGRASAFLYGTILRRGLEISNSALLLQQDEPFVQFYDKMHLVIMGEYVPFASTLPFLRKLVPLGTDFTPGKEARTMELGRQWRIAPLICFEDILPRVARRFMGGNPHFFVNITNDGWFQKSVQSWQHFQHARFRCIEFRRPMVRVANNGVTGWIDDRGIPREILRDAETGTVQFPGTLRTVVPMVETRTTFYARWGDWPGWLSLWLVLAAGVRVWVRSPFSRQKKNTARFIR